MNSRLHLATLAVAIAGSTVIVAAPAKATPGILNRLAEIEANGTSRESGARLNPFADYDVPQQGVEVAGDAPSISVDRASSRQSSFVERVRGLRSTSPESGASF